MANSNSKYFSSQDLVVYIFIYLFVHLFVVYALSPFLTGFNVTTSNLFQYIIIYMMILISSLWYRRVRCVKTMSPCRFVVSGGFNANYVLLGILLMTAVSIVLDPFNASHPEQIRDYVNTFMTGNKLVTIFVTVICAPIVEEILFRGILLKDMSVSWGARRAIFISSLLFALLHFNIIQMLNAFLGGMVIGYIYIYTNRSISTVIILHMINNLIATVSLYWGFAVNSVWQRYIPDGWIYNLIYIVASLLIALVVFRVVTIGQNNSVNKKLKFKEKI